MGVPYCIVKNKARLGRVARRKTVSCLAITNVSIQVANSESSSLTQEMMT